MGNSYMLGAVKNTKSGNSVYTLLVEIVSATRYNHVPRSATPGWMPHC